MAIADANYRFVAVDVGAPGRASDGGVWERSGLPAKIKRSYPDEVLRLPNGQQANHYFVGDPAFPLSMTMMKPYGGDFLTKTQRIFNYRHSRARRVVENVFGIAAARWRILRGSMECLPPMAKDAVLAITVLHNFCMTHESNYCPPSYADYIDAAGVLQLGAWRSDATGCNWLDIQRRVGNQSINSAKAFRDRLAHFFNTTGAVAWQDNCI